MKISYLLKHSLNENEQVGHVGALYGAFLAMMLAAGDEALPICFEISCNQLCSLRDSWNTFEAYYCSFLPVSL